MKLAKRGKPTAGPMAPVSMSPFWPLQRLQADIDRLLENPLGMWFPPRPNFLETWGPAVDVYEDKDNVFVKAELPGMKKEEIQVSLSNGLLHITGERTTETETKGAETYRSERYFGRFYRSIELPAPVEPKGIEAHYKNGILTVTCPKTHEAKRKQVEIKAD